MFNFMEDVKIAKYAVSDFTMECQCLGFACYDRDLLIDPNDGSLYYDGGESYFVQVSKRYVTKKLKKKLDRIVYKFHGVVVP